MKPEKAHLIDGSAAGRIHEWGIPLETLIPKYGPKAWGFNTASDSSACTQAQVIRGLQECPEGDLSVRDTRPDHRLEVDGDRTTLSRNGISPTADGPQGAAAIGQQHP